ncbi:3' terminal RNA ribose 2'-O-methyltransferase Hen1 [Acetonema longum]|uniref:Small RNA 2'-O-methyltransferase n=1 Tax=Acetonema longum DSM 6540 TaxID=1009370 RepID=F7NGU5_9FIRM|nr:3' terminal RNA ribose 2'-O-methyltransferase Hen1 [Acetonema longum]EGO64676.1 methyltransferase type 12 [Acetonema longum DSM 6540]
MLLTITYTRQPAADLGYLLHKNPSRPQTFDLSHGQAHIFYPEVTDERCTVVLLLDIDPLDLARGKRGSAAGGLFDYVNDRPYVASSFLSVAIAKVFGTAMTGRCKDRPELAAQALPFQAGIVMLPCRGQTAMIRRLFEPLGYTVGAEDYELDEQFPQWGKSRYFNVTLTAAVRLQDLLRHLYVLIPVLDSDKHYWIGEAEIDKLLRHGEGWLAGHPERELIIGRYLKRKRNLVDQALNRLLPDVSAAEEEAGQLPEEEAEDKRSLNEERLGTVVAALKSAQAKRVLDLGCGEGKLLALLLRDKSFEQLAGVDVSCSALERAKSRLKLERLSDLQRQRITLLQGSLTYRDQRFAGYDAATLVEVIEHLDPHRLAALEQVLFRFAKPHTVIVSTPNKEYNARYGLTASDMRHRDHRFEWTRGEFAAWATRVAECYGYSVRFMPVGAADPEVGSPTQMGVFTLWN